MNPSMSAHAQCFAGTLEQCVENFGGQSRFTFSPPVTFFSGARLETHRRAQSTDGTVVIIEQQLGPTICEVYLQTPTMRPQSAHAALLQQQTNCA
jgi:hypothetical protein